MTHNLKETCRQLRLSGLAASLELRLQEASSHQLSHVQFLELLLQDELNVRAREIVAKTLDESSAEEMGDYGVMKEKIRQDLKRFIVKSTARRPLILPVILEI